MTCVWDGLLQGLKKFNLVKDDYTIDKLVQYVKNNNKKTINVTHNNNFLSDKLLEENFERICKISHIKNGYFCSTCDPLMMLICELFNVNIIHKFIDVFVKYNSTANAKILLYVESDIEHFWINIKKSKIVK